MRDHSLPDLNAPAVVIAFSGWNDANNAASDALQFIAQQYPSTELETIDDERYFDFQATRPILRRSPDGPWIQWPQVSFHRVVVGDRPLILVMGPEPSQLWRSFAQDLIRRIERFQPGVVILLGAMLSDTPHTRSLPVAVSTYDTRLRSRLAIEDLDYEGPTGITGVVAQMLIPAGLPSASVWVSTPHYVNNSANPKAQHALLTRLEQLLDADLHSKSLEADAEQWTETVDMFAAQDPDVADYIEQLEQEHDASDVKGVTGESIAAEFEQYLRDQN